MEEPEEAQEVSTLELKPVLQIVQRPPTTGNACLWCGGMMVRTGACECCSECGTSGGCS